MIAWLAKDYDGTECIFLDNPELEEEEECINPYAEYPESFQFKKTGKNIWVGDILLLPDDIKVFSSRLGLPRIKSEQKRKIEIIIKEITDV